MFALIIAYSWRSLCLVLLACFLSACSSPRKPECELNPSNVPKVRGLRLGEWAFASGTPDEIGVIAARNMIELDSEDGVRAYADQILHFEGRVVHFRVVYENHTEKFAWDSVDQFVRQTAASLGLPTSWKSEDEIDPKESPELWRAKELLGATVKRYYVTGNREERFLLCGDILVSAAVPSPGRRHWTNGAFIQFDDLAALRRLKAQMDKRWAEEKTKEQKQREAFKP